MKTIKTNCYLKESNHSYWTKDNKEILHPSVSTIVNHFYPIDFDDIPKEILEKAIIRGTCVHKTLENWVKYKGRGKWLQDCNCKSIVKAHLVQSAFAINELNQYCFDKTWTELSLNGECFCGTIDLLVENDNEFSIIDYKTTKKVHREREALQLVCYAYLLKENFDIEISEYRVINTNVRENYSFSEEEIEVAKKILEYWIEQQENFWDN